MEELTREGVQHVDDAQEPHLPVEDCFAQVAYLEVFLFPHGRVVVFCSEFESNCPYTRAMATYSCDVLHRSALRG